MNIQIAKKKYVFCVLVLWCFSFSSTIHAGECRKIVLNGAVGWEPVIWRDEGGTARGILVDIVAKIFDSIGITYEFDSELPWKRQLLRLEEGKLDMVVGAYFNEERSQRFLYSAPVFEEEIRVFVNPKKSFKFDKFEDLKQWRGIRPLGGTYGTVFDSYARQHLNIREEHNPHLLIKLVALGRVDYAVLSHLDGLIGAIREGYHKDFIPLKNNVAANNIYFMMSKKSACAGFLPLINENIRKLVKSGEPKRLQELYIQQFGLSHLEEAD